MRIDSRDMSFVPAGREFLMGTCHANLHGPLEVILAPLTLAPLPTDINLIFDMLLTPTARKHPDTQDRIP